MFDELLKRVEQVQKNIDNYLLDQVEENKGFILDLNRAQLMIGEDSKKKKIEPAYTAYTKRLKRFKGQPTNRVTLKDTGVYHKSFYLDVRDDHFIIDTNDELADKLEIKYGDDLLGLSTDNIGVMTAKIKDPFLTTIKEEILK
mgnify:CR=1 FL=1